MGLDIKEYSYSYSVLHRLRQAAIYCCGYDFYIWDFYNRSDCADYPFSIFVNFSDCDGMYVSKRSKQYEKLQKYVTNHYSGPLNMFFGDLDELKTFVKSINEAMTERLSASISDLQAWRDFYSDVVSSRMIMKFH